MTNDIPSFTVSEQTINTPIRGDTTIMDDTVMTMDGSALMGGPVTIVEGVQSKAEVSRVFTKIPRSS